MRVFELCHAQPAPSSLDGFAGLALLGGPMSANDDWQPLRDSEQLIREALRDGVPVFGHCLGGQLMSRALGGVVGPADCAEIGWTQIRAVDLPLARHWFGKQEFPMFQWHSDSFSVPEGAELLATGAYCRHQAYALGQLHLGVQFHCEIDRSKIESWLTVEESQDIDLYAHSPAVCRHQEIRAATAKLLSASQRTAAHMYDRWLERLVR
jgi:GMP synthase (glutamine-hydrolysing)